MRKKKSEVHWPELRFESKTMSYPSFDEWVKKIAFVQRLKMFTKLGIRKALNLARFILINWKYFGLQFLIFRWSTDIHKVVAAWWNFWRCFSFDYAQTIWCYPPRWDRTWQEGPRGTNFLNKVLSEWMSPSNKATNLDSLFWDLKRLEQ